MSRSMQVITITHLPQIAAKGDAHFRVYKEDTKLQTETYIAKLSDSERIDEIAAMLSGKERGVAAVENAKELLGWEWCLISAQLLRCFRYSGSRVPCSVV